MGKRMSGSSQMALSGNERLRRPGIASIFLFEVRAQLSL